MVSLDGGQHQDRLADFGRIVHAAKGVHRPERGIGPGHRRRADAERRILLQDRGVAGIAHGIAGEGIVDEGLRAGQRVAAAGNVTAALPRQPHDPQQRARRKRGARGPAGRSSAPTAPCGRTSACPHARPAASPRRPSNAPARKRAAGNPAAPPAARRSRRRPRNRRSRGHSPCADRAGGATNAPARASRSSPPQSRGRASRAPSRNISRSARCAR